MSELHEQKPHQIERDCSDAVRVFRDASNPTICQEDKFTFTFQIGWLFWKKIQPNLNYYPTGEKKTYSLKIDGWKMKSPFKVVPFQGTC